MVKNDDKFSIEDAKAVIESGKKQSHINYSLLILEQCLDT